MTATAIGQAPEVAEKPFGLGNLGMGPLPHRAPPGGVRLLPRPGPAPAERGATAVRGAVGQAAHPTLTQGGPPRRRQGKGINKTAAELGVGSSTVRRVIAEDKE